MKKFIVQMLLLLLAWPAQPVMALTPPMTTNEVETILAQAMTRAATFISNGTSTNAVVAVVDREGFILGVVSMQFADVDLASFTNSLPYVLSIINAVTKAGTAAFLSSDQDAFTSRTAGYIVQQHFPPTISDASPGPLVGVNLSSLSFSDINYFKDPAGYSTNAFGGGGTNGFPLPVARWRAPDRSEWLTRRHASLRERPVGRWCRRGRCKGRARSRNWTRFNRWPSAITVSMKTWRWQGSTAIRHRR